jgi:hypothetical protein
MRKRIFSIALATLLVLSILPTLMLPVYASSKSSWSAALPYEDALLNQTLTTYKHDTHAEVALSANLYVLQKDYPQPGQYEFAIAVVAAANSRYQMGYTASFTSGDIYEPSNTLSLGDNSGAWVDTGAYGINYYGAWYRKIFISSNGFVVLDQRAYDDGGGKWTSPNPQSIPSTDDPNVLIAPFWRDLDPSKGGRIKYGSGPMSFVVAWIGIPNKANSNTQTFAIYFYEGIGESISFIYGSITNDVATSIGMEDQAGKRGLAIPSVSSGQRINFDQITQDNLRCITQIKVSASKLSESGTNDGDAIIQIDGLDDPLPGGVNVELYDPSEGQYNRFPIGAAAGATIGGLGLLTGNWWLGALGFAVDVADLVYELSPVTSSTVHEANPSTQTAYTLNLAQDENRPDLWPWDVSTFALFRWRLLNPSVNHRLVLNVQVDYGWPTGSYTIISDPLELALSPGDANTSWYGRTNPDAHYFSFSQISTPYGPGYHIDTTGSDDSGYEFMGWSKLTDDIPEDYKVGTDGKIRVQGYFRQSDTLSPPENLPGRRLVNVYVMYSDNLNQTVKTAQVLDYTDGTGWKYKAIIIDGLTPSKSIKIGIGRGDQWLSDWNLIAEWAGVEVHESGGNPPLIPSTPSGDAFGYTGTAYVYSSSTIDPDGDSIYYEFDWGAGPTTIIGPFPSDNNPVYASHTWNTPGTYDIAVRAMDVYGLWSDWSGNLAVTLEPTLGTILNQLGFTNIQESTATTFGPGIYRVTLYAEFAGYHAFNNLSWYSVGTADYSLIFAGADGNYGYVNPPLTKTFTAYTQFGLSFQSPEARYFTETRRNPDGLKHDQIYLNLNNLNMFLIGFENRLGVAGEDFNDMVISLEKTSDLPTVNLVISVPQAPPEGVTIWIDGTVHTAYVNIPANVSVTIGPHTLQAQQSFDKEGWKPGYYYTYTFLQWSDGSTENPRTITILSDTSIAANYLRSRYPWTRPPL